MVVFSYMQGEVGKNISMKIYKARVMGFCYGVRKAMEIAENASCFRTEDGYFGADYPQSPGRGKACGERDFSRDEY